MTRRSSPMLCPLPQTAPRRSLLSTGRPPQLSLSIPRQALRFSAQFRLTFAETRVLGEIVGGTGILAAAAKLNSSESTVRTHANRILAKTGTMRQTELIRRFFETALPVVSG